MSDNAEVSSSLGSCLSRIDAFESHEDDERAKEDIAEAFGLVRSFEEQEVLAATLIKMADEFQLGYGVVLEGLWRRLELYPDEARRASTLMHMAWFVAPKFPWLRRVETGQAAQMLERLPESDVGAFVFGRSGALWALLEDPNSLVAGAAAMVLGGSQALSADDASLLLALAKERADPVCLASTIHALGAAAWTGRLVWGKTGRHQLTRELQAELCHDDLWVALCAVGSYGLLDGRVPAPATEVLVRGLEAARPLPKQWRAERLWWTEYDSAWAACLVAIDAQTDDQAALLTALRNLPSGRNKALADRVLAKLPTREPFSL